MLRSVQAVPVPIGNYIRPSRRDQTVLLDLLGEERLPTTGVVIDPSLWGIHEELSRESLSHGLEVLLDSQMLDLATVAGFARSGLRELPWADERPHQPHDLRGDRTQEAVGKVLDFAENKSFTGYLAPTHFIATAESDWLDVDIALARRMREELNRRGQSDKPMYYPLVVHADLLRNPGHRRRLIERLGTVDADAIWLRVHPFGSSSGPLALRRYIEACRDLHALGIPIVGDRTGTVGVAMAAFGAIGGVEGGLTIGERFDVSSLTRPRTGDPFAPAPRVYIPEIGAFLTRKQARLLFEQHGMKTAFGCRREGCCRRGARDMVADPRPHFLVCRGAELSSLSNMPEPLRAGRYLEEFLRPATDLAARATRALPELESHRKRLDGWRQALGVMYRRDLEASITYSRAPDGLRISRRLGA